MRAPLMPFCARKLRTVVARRAPSAMLYSRVPRSSAWPSIVIVYCGYCCSQWACLVSVCVRFRRQIDGVRREVDDVADVLSEVALRARALQRRTCRSTHQAAALCWRRTRRAIAARIETAARRSPKLRATEASISLSLSSRRQLSGKPLYLFSHSARRLLFSLQSSEPFSRKCGRFRRPERNYACRDTCRP